jgi:hypothetical protein
MSPAMARKEDEFHPAQLASDEIVRWRTKRCAHRDSAQLGEPGQLVETAASDYADGLHRAGPP